MRRSPAENYIRYRMVVDRGLPIEKLAAKLTAELVFAPSRKYLEEMRDSLVFPMVFRPMDLRHTMSQAFLRRNKIWSLFHPSRATTEALTAFRDEPARSLLQTLIAGPSPDPVILDVFVKRIGLQLSDAGLSEFKHYFWNLKLVTLQEAAEYVSTFLRDRSITYALRLPKSQDGMFMAMVKLGINPKEIDESETYEMFERLFKVNAMEISHRMDVGLPQATALKMAFEGFQMAEQRRKVLASDRGEIIDQLLAVRADMRDIPAGTLIDLQQGKAPPPVGLLPAQPDDDEEEEDDAGRSTG